MYRYWYMYLLHFTAFYNVHFWTHLIFYSNSINASFRLCILTYLLKSICAMPSIGCYSNRSSNNNILKVGMCTCNYRILIMQEEIHSQLLWIKKTTCSFKQKCKWKWKTKIIIFLENKTCKHIKSKSKRKISCNLPLERHLEIKYGDDSINCLQRYLFWLWCIHISNTYW